VWICPQANGHLQATGRDAKCRKQYRYHNRWREVRDADKFSRLLHFGEALGDLRAQVDADLAKPGAGLDQVLAAVVRLLDDTLIRVGNEEYAATNESFGLTTLRPDHVDDIGRKAFTLRFVGKSGIEHDVTVEDPKLSRLVRRCHELNGQELFSYRDEDGQVARLSSSDVNEYLHRTVGPDTSAKVFRTWGASTIVTRTLAETDVPDTDEEADKQIVAAIDIAADQLRNTRAVCRQSYVHPAVFDAYRDGVIADTWHSARTAGHLNRADRTLLHILQDHG
jgi:DNA topoisomerase-1